MAFDSLVGSLLEIAIILFGISLSVLDMLWYIRHKTDIWRWVKLCYSGVGVFWAIVYAYILFSGYHGGNFGETWIRTGILATVGLMNVGASLRLKLDNDKKKHHLED